jgi:hypothetical protein
MVFSSTFKGTFKSFTHGRGNPFLSTTNHTSRGGKRIMSPQSPEIRTRSAVDGRRGLGMSVVTTVAVVVEGRVARVVQVD